MNTIKISLYIFFQFRFGSKTDEQNGGRQKNAGGKHQLWPNMDSMVQWSDTRYPYQKRSSKTLKREKVLLHGYWVRLCIYHLAQ